MANTKFIALSPVHVSTTVSQVVVDPGQRGVLYINVGDADGLETYHNITDFEQKYEVDSAIWNQANAYFENALDGQVQVMNVNSKGTLFAHAKAPNLTATTTDTSVTFTATPTDGDTPSEADLIIDRLLKYYGAGFQYIVYPCATGDEATAIALSNFVEAQDTGYLFVNVTTDPATPADFSAFDAIKDNRATKLVSLNSTLDPDSVVASNALGKYVEQPIGSNYNFINGLEEVEPQDKYEFSRDDLAAYDKYNVATYAYENNTTPMITNGRSLSGVSTGIMIYKDYLTRTITNRVTDYLVQNKPPYNASTVKAIVSIIQGVLADGVANANIEEYNIPAFDADALSDEIKATGKLTGIQWTYKPMRFIDEAWFQQGLELTINE